MEWLRDILTSANAIPVMVFALVVIIIGLVMVKKGTLSFNGKGVKIGASDNERAIIRNQFEYIYAIVEGFADRFPTHLDQYRVKYVLARVEQEFYKIAVFNHISDKSEYIKTKQEIVYNAILKRTDDDFFRSQEFKEMVYSSTETIIKRMLEIRKQYEKEQ